MKMPQKLRLARKKRQFRQIKQTLAVGGMGQGRLEYPIIIETEKKLEEMQR